ncbi:zinc finger CCHC domain-containing protein 8 isoform X1 [Stegostoma tigrinum]|uniref:zinc finger CCHC domain-containing protein 8 isoform X1 n=1 Tax=Stegostoma tigrinum TaxID=3053191 RepID=UPI0028703D38|nr:zinc finger CCHC domain-containing protein 8 isoform X1 [Stegostoma tigrinum]
MAAERVDLDFGDRELFEEFEDSKPSHIRFNDLEDAGEAEAMREKLLEFEERIGYLKAENAELKRKLNLLTQPSKIVVSDSKTDGPMVQILFMNNNISKQFHQEIEDFITSLVGRYEKDMQSDPEKTSFNVKPQPSSVLLEEHLKVKTSNAVKKIKEAFHVVGSVQYFTNFCLDKLGQPLLNENPQLTNGWEIPKYQQVFAQVVSLEGQEVELKAKRPKPCCFNCGSTEHQLKDCPKPRDLARISEKRKEFMTMASDSPHSGSQQRYHAERFEKFKPGVLSVELKEALGMTDETLPPFIYRMRQLGYPPGWLLETQQENSGLALYDGKDSSDSETEHDKQHLKSRLPSYDTSKLIDYAGFNTVIPKGIQDEWRQYGSIPMQAHHLKEYFAHQLAADYPMTKHSANKRGSDADSSLRSVKKRKSEEIDINSFDMEIDSGSDTPPRSFQPLPPLPSDCPLTSSSSPPPLPKGTPPSTPPMFIPPAPPTPTPPPLPKDTPPSTPSNCSPGGYSLEEGSARASAAENADKTLDADVLSLEELEEQQRLIWAELEQTESANSETEGPCDSPLMKNSTNSSPAMHAPDNHMEVEPVDKMGTLESNMGSPVAEASSVNFRDEQTTSYREESAPSENSGMEIEGSRTIQDSTSTPATSVEENQVCSEKIEESITCDAVSEGREENRISSVPDMSKFATGITPFEYDNLSEATGTYLKLRNLLKNSPRNKMKRK